MDSSEGMVMSANRFVVNVQLVVELGGKDDDSGGDAAPAVFVFESS